MASRHSILQLRVWHSFPFLGLEKAVSLHSSPALKCSDVGGRPHLSHAICHLFSTPNT